MSTNSDESILTRFNPVARQWFEETFGAPTAVQEATWSAISAGKNVLVGAPTGSGKTLAAFFWALQGLIQPVRHPTLFHSDLASGIAKKTVEKQTSQAKVKVLYISPLKALGVDVEKNLNIPLAAMREVAQRTGAGIEEISIGVRSGDTTAAQRAQQRRNPPEILITTPESIYLLLTSQAREILSEVECVIIDEIHAVADSKRGVHLALSLERLEHLVGKPVQRIGLSATVRPLSLVAQFLAGNRPVEIINPPLEKTWQLDVHVPVSDMKNPASPVTDIDPALTATHKPLASDSALAVDASLWPFVEKELFDEIMAHRSSLIFVNSRRAAERLSSRLNELYAQKFSPEELAPPTRRNPAQVMVSTAVAGSAPTFIARAHHGSVSKQEREITEQMLKNGEIKAVVATSSLELGIDMGAIELVVQVESPPSVASAIQRVGRAGHAVAAVSQGSFYPMHQADLVQTAVIMHQMGKGLIEEISVPQNALDVLSQQTVAAVAVDDWHSDHWYELVRRAYPYRNLARSVFDSVIDLISGAYPATDFAELKPRVVFDHETSVLSARPGAQRVAVTSGGTIPDRGLYGVYLLSGEKGSRRVGELDEEMVYESRVGDVFTLGASSWRIEAITNDQVHVSPAPGHTGRLPFWLGDDMTRPAELGKAIGAFRRAIATNPTQLEQFLDGVETNVRTNILHFLSEQQKATGQIPDEETLLLERFTDEVGDWQVVFHSPFGQAVNAAWALAVSARFEQRTGIDVQPVSNNDSIVLRIPYGQELPTAELFIIHPEEIEDIVRSQVAGSALFAARFRECAARALLLPKRDPGKRAPLWQQRLRASQLLSVAKKYPRFPIILETVRECIHDVYDLASLREVLGDIAQKRITIVEVTTETPSPFAASSLFHYRGGFIYQEDSPLAEKRAAALNLDTELLTQLLGTVELRELLDISVIETIDAQLRRVAIGYRARTEEELADLLRILGPIPVKQLAEKLDFDYHDELATRTMQVAINGVMHIAQIQDAVVLRDALGVVLPAQIASTAPSEIMVDALSQLVARWSRHRGPFVLTQLQEAFGLSSSIAHAVVESLCQPEHMRTGNKLIAGHFRTGVEETEYINAQVLDRIRRISLAQARAHTRAVSQSSYARFLPPWQHVAAVGCTPKLSGADGVYEVIEQLAGIRLPASTWETLVFPARIKNYQPSYLDELTTTGEVLIIGAGVATSNDPWIMLLPRDDASELLSPQEVELNPIQQKIVELLATGGGFYYADIRSHISTTVASDEQLREALWDSVAKSVIMPDSFAALRAHLYSGSGAKTTSRGGRFNTGSRLTRRSGRSGLRRGRLTTGFVRQASAPDLMGRWSLAPQANNQVTKNALLRSEIWLDRYGVVTRGSVVAEEVSGGFQLAYKTLSQFEHAGKAVRGLFIDGLGAAQFSTAAVVDRLRNYSDSPTKPSTGHWPSGTTSPEVYILAACDPANPYGAALAWPKSGCTRKAGALVVLIDGLLAAYLSRGGRKLQLFEEVLDYSADVLTLIVAALSEYVQRTQRALTIETINGDAALSSQYLPQFQQLAAPISITPRGLRIAVLRTEQTISVRSSESTTRGRTLTQALEQTPTDNTAPEVGGFLSGRDR
ncbi:ATP-dependent helicase lhr [Corynebacterium kutscheri]|uniref:ATP-dependent helicase n=1 Tax=Corynebacterium kutscheri TaxID=35755 RepID=UPI000F70B99F|nr:ATP-dependent helicase [Corynebacterium kutscheri]VEH80272.1 ATP-dependent helicase lhr [Corynebacterium kutscheri]